MEYKFGKNKEKFRDEVKFWICHMCIANYNKPWNRSLVPVSEWVSDLCLFCGITMQYAKKVYDYILDNNEYDFETDSYSWCYVSGEVWDEWDKDYFVIPISNYTEEEWCIMCDDLMDKLTGKSKAKCENV